MAAMKDSPNGGAKNKQNQFGNAEIEFPVTFVLKAVMDKLGSDEVNMEIIQMVLDNNEIKSKFKNSVNSSKGTYTSYHYEVTLISKLQMETMYAELKTLPGLKFAL